jgi:signal transduction histidine kinase
LKLKEGERPDPGYAHMARDIARIQLNIKTTIQDLKPASLDSRHAENLAKALRHEIDQSLRPLSQRLWVKSLYAPPSTKIGSVIANAVTELNYPFLLSASLYAFANIVNTTQSLGLYAAVLYAFSTFVMFSIFETIRKLLIMKLFARRKLINILFVASIGLMVGVIVNWSFDLLNFHYSYHIALFTSPSLPILIAAVASIKLTLQDRESLLSLLKEKISGYKDVEYDLVSQGNAASYLHNSLQSELTALALQLDSLAQNPDPERNKYVMEKLDAFVSQSKSEDFQNFLETPQVRLDRIVNSWDGIAKVKLKIDPDIWSDSIRGSLVVSLLQEAIANAVRSGKANQIEVKGIIEGDSIVVTVFDNGAASSLSERRGIGSQWIDRIAISDWNLEQTDSGHVLRVEF